MTDRVGRSILRAMTKRELEALKLHLFNPDWTMADIGREMGISRERVRQLLLKSGVKIGHKRIALTQKGV